jgi:hypothetical protein
MGELGKFKGKGSEEREPKQINTNKYLSLQEITAFNLKAISEMNEL